MAVTEEEILERVLDSYADEFKELSDTWKQVDQKAQGTTAIAGIFLAAVFAWAREVPSGMPHGDLAILAVVTFLLACSIGCALWSMRVRTATLPPFGKVTRTMAEDCCANLATPGMVPDFYRQLASSWEEANKALAAQTNDKAHYARCAQVVLVAAAAGAMVIAILAICRGAPIP